MQVRSLGGQDPREAGRATRPSILAWGIPTDRGAWGRQSMGSQRVGLNCSDLAGNKGVPAWMRQQQRP